VEDISGSNYGIDHDSIQCYDVSSPLINDIAEENVEDSSLTAPVNEASTAHINHQLQPL
jgi:hypothetical protein